MSFVRNQISNVHFIYVHFICNYNSENVGILLIKEQSTPSSGNLVFLIWIIAFLSVVI